MILQHLKSFIILFGFLLLCQENFSASFVKTTNSNTPVTNQPDYLKASVFVKLSVKEFTKATGAKLNFLQKLYVKTLQLKLTRELKKNPDLLISNYYDQKKAKFKIDPLWFVIGAILGPLGILFSFTNKQKKDKRKSAMLGCALFVVWFGILFVF